MLGIIALIEFLTFQLPPHPRQPLVNFICLALFGIIGLELPKNQPVDKAIYTGLEIGFILVSSIWGGIRLAPLLIIIFVIRNCFIFKGNSRLIITLFAFVLFVVSELYRIQNMPRPMGIRFLPPERFIFIFVSSTILFGLVVVFLQLLVDAVLSERESREELAQANAQLRQYALRIEDIATLQERNRIAREIHDSLGHSLTVFNLHLEAALRLLDANPTEAKEFISEAKQLGATALKDVRQSVATLRSDIWRGQSLETAIASLIEDCYKSTGILPILSLDLQQQIPAEVKMAIYRIIQESLTNICKYATATEVEITIEAKIDVHLIVRDNGRGFNLNQNTTGFGLQGMRERTQALGGQFKIVTAPAQGCQIIANFPLSTL